MTVRRQMELDGTWRFCTDPELKGLQRKWFKRAPGAAMRVWVPGAWNLYDPSLFNYRGNAWYFRHFRADELLSGGVAVLRFEGVQYRATVWLNGVKLGTHEGSYTPFEFDVTGKLRTDGANFLAVLVDNTLDDKTVPPWGVDYFVYGGIFREVRLTSMPAFRVADERVITKISGLVTVEAEIANSGKSRASGDLLVSLHDEEGRTVVETAKSVECRAGGRSRVSLAMRVRRPRLWDISDPHLYEARIELLAGGLLCDEKRLNVGIREIAARGNRIILNGRPIKIHGISRHEDHPQIGNCASEEVLVRDYMLMKQANCNLVRLAHYTHSEREIAIADRMGMLVFAEIPNLFMTEAMLERPQALDLCKQYLREMIERDKNHPSIVLWGMAIECRTDKPVGERFMKELFAYGRKLDSTRLFIHASDRILKERAYKYADVIGCNAFQGWYDYTPPGTFHGQVLDTVRKRFPNKPIILSSHGAEALAGRRSLENERWTEDYQCFYIEKVARQVLARPFVSGEVLWHFMDFRVDRWNPGQGLFAGTHTFKVRPGEYNNKGIVDRDRHPKNAFYTLRAIYAKWKRLYPARPRRGR